MTLICVRLDKSFSTTRMVALADSRASIRRDDGSWKVVSDTTTKLFALPVRCYDPDHLTPILGAWRDPYHECIVGLGFAGSCFEALTIVAALSNALVALCDVDSNYPTPTGQGILSVAEHLTRNYFQGHSGDGAPKVLFLLFGFEGHQPWIGRIEGSKAAVTSKFTWATEVTLETVGVSDLFNQYAAKWRTTIQKHRVKASTKVRETNSDDRDFEKNLELSRHDTAEKKIVEEEMLDCIEREYLDSIGGVLQKLEIAEQNGAVRYAFTRDDRPYLDAGSASASHSALLVPIEIVERMGRPVRPATV